MTKREMRCPHKDKISDCSECMAELNAMGAPASPEQFLREFADAAIHNWTNTPEDLEKLIKSWAKLLKLREDAARLDELGNMTFIDRDGAQTFMPFTQYRCTKDGLLLSWEDRIAQLTTPNNTSNTLEDEVTK